MIDLTQLDALLWVQWTSTRNSLRQRSERRGKVISIVLSCAWYAFWVFLAFACAIVPVAIGREDIESALAGILLFIMGYWQLSPIITLTLGSSLQMGKLAHYPASTRTLFVVECLLRLWSGFEMILLLLGLFSGLAWAGSPHLAGLAAGFVLFVAFNVFLSAGTRNLVERIFQKRRLREVVLVGLIGLTVLPQALAFSAQARQWVRAAARNDVAVPYWLFPSGLAARLGVGEASANDVLLLLAMVAAALMFGYWMFRSNSRFTSSVDDRGPGSARSLAASIARLPSKILPDPVGALVEKEVKYLWRSPRFRLPFFMGFTFGVLAWAPLIYSRGGASGEFLQHRAVTLISLYAFLLLGPVLFLNRFGFDRAASRFYFWMPLSPSEILASKNITTVLFAYSELLMAAVICKAVGLPVGLEELLEAIAVGAVALMSLMAVGNYMSVRFPAPTNPDRVSRSGPGHGLRATLHFLIFPFALTPIFAAYILRYQSQSAELFAAILVAGCLVGATLYWRSFMWASTQLHDRREQLVASLASDQGPVASE